MQIQKPKGQTSHLKNENVQIRKPKDQILYQKDENDEKRKIEKPF